MGAGRAPSVGPPVQEVRPLMAGGEVLGPAAHALRAQAQVRTLDLSLTLAIGKAVRHFLNWDEVRKRAGC